MTRTVCESQNMIANGIDDMDSPDRWAEINEQIVACMREQQKTKNASDKGGLQSSAGDAASRALKLEYVEGPTGCAIIDRRLNSNVATTPATITFSIFHTDVKRLSPRRSLVDLDSDLRRPLLRAEFNSSTELFSWLSDNCHLFLACVVTFSEWCSHLAGFEVCTFWKATNQEKLHRFAAWQAHVLGKPAPVWCKANVTIFENTTAAVGSNGEWSIADFNAILNERATPTDCEWRKTVPEPGTDSKTLEDIGDLSVFALERYNREVLEDAEVGGHG